MQHAANLIENESEKKREREEREHVNTTLLSGPSTTPKLSPVVAVIISKATAIPCPYHTV